MQQGFQPATLCWILENQAAQGGAIQLPSLPGSTWAMGVGLAVLIGAVVGLLPALRGMRLNIVDALAGR